MTEHKILKVNFACNRPSQKKKPFQARSLESQTFVSLSKDKVNEGRKAF